MTSVRAKRNSKAPNRFSSDNLRIETSNADGETIIDFNDHSTSTTHNLGPINKSIKLKPVGREPLKVKLPKLKRLSGHTPLVSSKDSPAKSNLNGLGEVRIHKIKLPSLKARKARLEAIKTSSEDNHMRTNLPSAANVDKKRQPSEANGVGTPSPTGTSGNMNITMSRDNNSGDVSSSSSASSSHQAYKPTIPPVKLSLLHNSAAKHSTAKPTNSPGATQKAATYASPMKHTGSNTCAATEPDTSLSFNTSFSSDDTDGSRMQIVVSRPEPAANSSGIRCACGVDDDLGVMVECESCSTWQHGHCINVGCEDDAYEGYVCAFCLMPEERVQDSLQELMIDDKFKARFMLLANIVRQNAAKPADDAAPATKNGSSGVENVQLAPKEIAQTIKDLRRVMNSLQAKWKLLTSQAYESELRIWQNPFWGRGEQSGDQNLYFVARYKDNLRLNVRNMVRMLDERCKLIDFALAAVDSSSPTADEVRLKRALDDMASAVREYKHKLKNLPDS